MAAIADQTMLDTIQNGINTIVTCGQSYELGGVTYTRANLRELMELEQYYRRRVASASLPGGRTLAEF